ncbi:MAG: D-alanyl-D-alanine carboxypeptidase/D-alanyl-D-alanine-endopeptidase [Rubrivivax sp. SCN 70-15]|nr:MAG: D-alanyl-D-alanine carboxypeptidase/D-alanyl-D-alanine-endopeptidase [Rubrivivax sp. SCN 70-15]
MPTVPTALLRWLLVCAVSVAPCARAAPALPVAVRAALAHAGVPASALAAVVGEAGGGRPLLQWQADRPMQPASLTKLVTTAAALDLLGPGWRWHTPVWMQGPLEHGVLHGSVFIRGSGDPSLVQERVWLLLQRLREAGVRRIDGDIVLDESAFELPPIAPDAFDGEPLRPYNVRPAALLLNFRSRLYTFTPDPLRGVARVRVEPALDTSPMERTVPLSDGPCVDWRGALAARFAADGTRFAGRYPASCGEQSWAVADPEPASFDARLLATLWHGMGGELVGRVREGRAPEGAAPSFDWVSPPLAEVVRDINKYSNDLMAEQLALTLPLALRGAAPATPESARRMLTDWLAERTGAAEAAAAFIENGSGLSRRTRLSAAQLAAVLGWAWRSPLMSELMSSLPIPGVDGTLRHDERMGRTAHLKTGSLRDVVGLAGWVLADDGRRYRLVAIVNDAHAQAARPALDALVRWTARRARSQRSAP